VNIWKTCGIQIRRWLAPWILSGKVMEWWLQRQTTILAEEYSRFILGCTSKMPPKPENFRSVSGLKLNRILFICDNMWEQRELLPELAKLAQVDFVDVSPWRLTGRVSAEDRLDLDKVRIHLNKFLGRNYEAVVVYLNAALLSHDLFEILRPRTDGLLLGMNLDDKGSYPNYNVFQRSAQNYRRWAGYFDCNLTNSLAMVDIYKDDGHSCLYLPTGFHYDPRIHYFRPPSHFEYDLSFVGSCKHERRLFVEALQSKGLKISTFGGGWPQSQFNQEGASIYRNSLINLGIGYNLPGYQFTNLKNRDFECPGSGGCYLTTYDWELAGCYEIGKEILCYRDMNDFCEIYAHYRRRPEACIEIARAGFERARSQHTWAHRFASIFSTLGFSQNQFPLIRSL